MRFSYLAVAVALAALAATQLACSSGPSTEGAVAPDDGKLKIEDIQEGTGKPAQTGETVVVHYTGRLINGIKFDSSLDRNQPFSFRLGAGEVIKGWDEGIVGMKEGGKRRLTIPPALGYGRNGSPPKIPPDSTLVFDVELLKIK